CQRASPPEARRTSPNERYAANGVDHRTFFTLFPSGEVWYRSSDQKFFNSPACLNDSSARIVWPAFVKLARAVRSSTGSHAIAGSISVAGAMTHMSLNIVTVSPWFISGPETSTTGTSAAALTVIEADDP